MILVVTGVAGAGKSTIGTLVAARLGWPYLDADDFHSPDALRKMERGEPLDEVDREPWLRAMADAIRGVGDRAVVSCSCLRRAHRERLRSAGRDVRFVHLRIDPETAARRAEGRSGHFFDPDLVQSQFEALEEPVEGVTLDATRTPSELVDEVVAWMGSPSV